MNSIITNIISAVGVVGGWEAIRYMLNRKTNQRMEETKADSLEFSLMKETIDFLQQQLKDKELRFAEQTEIVRQLNSDVLKITNEKAPSNWNFRDISAWCLNAQKDNLKTDISMEKSKLPRGLRNNKPG